MPWVQTPALPKTERERERERSNWSHTRDPQWFFSGILSSNIGSQKAMEFKMLRGHVSPGMVTHVHSPHYWGGWAKKSSGIPGQLKLHSETYFKNKITREKHLFNQKTYLTKLFFKRCGSTKSWGGGGEGSLSQDLPRRNADCTSQWLKTVKGNKSFQ
jgi:hypothetical protein